MTQRITLSIKPEKRKMLERLARQRHTTMSGVLDALLEQESTSKKESAAAQPLLGDMLAALQIRKEYQTAKTPQEALAMVRHKKTGLQ